VYMGIDGGGTKTLCIIGGENGRIMGVGAGGPVNMNYVPEETAIRSLRKAIEEARRAMGSPERRAAFFKVIYLSAPALRTETVTKALAEMNIVYDSLVLKGDDESCHMGALAGAPGIVVLAGTGSFAVGKNRRGKKALAGGWGPLLGDEGSAYYIGVAALKALARAGEGRGPATKLEDIFRAELGLDRFNLRREVYKPSFTREKISGLAVFVSHAANQGDRVATEILKNAGKELAGLANTVAFKLGMKKEPFPLCLTGGVSRAGPFLTESLLQEVGKKYSGAFWVDPRYEPAVGAFLLALATGGIKITAMLLANLNQSLKKLKGAGRCRP